MNKKRLFVSLLYITLLSLSGCHTVSKETTRETVKSLIETESESTGRYQITVPWIDYSTESYKVDVKEMSQEVIMPLHTDKIKLDDIEKEMYLLSDYKEDFYFGSKILKTTSYSLVEIYPENRSESFYFYQIQTYDESFSDKGIIDHSSGVNINQLVELVWLDMSYGSNANSLRVFNVGEKPEISKIIDIPFDYNIYTDYNENDNKNLVTYCTYDSGNLVVKVIDIFNWDDFSYTIDRGITEFCSPRFLNREEVYIEYEVDEHYDKMLVREIVDFKSNLTVYYQENGILGNEIYSEVYEDDIYGRVDYPLLDIPIRYNQSEVILVIQNNITDSDKNEYLVTDSRDVLDDMQIMFRVVTFPIDRGTTPDSVVYIFEDKVLTKRVPFWDTYENNRKFDLKTMSQTEVEELIEQEIPHAY